MTIKKIDECSVVKIITCQIISGITGAAKELVENSLDANATTIDIRFVNYGLDRISVSDDGIGIDREDLELVGKQHHTSKLVEYADLQNLKTYGFRGTCLHALSEISRQVTIRTKNGRGVGSNQPNCQGWEMILRPSGERSIRPAVRKQGTSVDVDDLFTNLPVRRRVLMKSAKREIHEFLSIAQAISITNQTTAHLHRQRNSNSNQTGSVPLLAAAAGAEISSNNSTTDLITAIRSILSLEQISLSNFVQFNDANCNGLTVDGVLSLISIPNGRIPNSKYVLINGRFVSHHKFLRTIHKIYVREFAVVGLDNQLVFLRITMPRSQVDVNLDQHKQAVLIRCEAELIAMIESCLRKALQEKSSSGILTESIQTNHGAMSQSNEDVSPLKLRKTKIMDRSIFKDISHNNEFSPSPTKSIGMIKHKFAKSNEDGPHSKSPKTLLDRSIFNDIYEESSSSITKSIGMIKPEFAKPNEDVKSPKTLLERSIFNDASRNSESSQLAIRRSSTPRKLYKPLNLDSDEESVPAIPCKLPKREETPKRQQSLTTDLPTTQTSSVKRIINKRMESLHVECVEVEFDLDEMAKDFVRNSSMSQIATTSNFEHHLTSTNEEAEGEFERILTRDCFGKMSVIGQFNRGFILASIGRNVFVIDQHAADECFRYQTLISSFGLGGSGEFRGLAKRYTQPLISPIRLNLSANAESTLIMHSDTFCEMGFRVNVDLAEKIGSRVSLCSVPSIAGFQFDVSDLIELVLNSQESGFPDQFTGEIHRRQSLVCSSMTKFFASKACRSAFMIGTTLNRDQMKRILQQMTGISRPWQCAHGRPTVRHLIKLKS